MDEYQIIQLVKDWHKTEQVEVIENFLFNNKTIISVHSYQLSYEQNPSINKQVIGYVYMFNTNLLSLFEFPMIYYNYAILTSLYLYKIGYILEDESFGPAPLPNLKYYIVLIEYQDKLAIELVDLDVVVSNLNLPKIVSSVLGSKLISTNEITVHKLSKIIVQTFNQKLLAGHTWDDAWKIVYDYFDDNQRHLAKDVFKISQAYERVFRPYRIVYDTKTWEPVVV